MSNVFNGVDLSNESPAVIAELQKLYQEDLRREAVDSARTIEQEAVLNRNGERSIDGVGSRVLSVPTAVFAMAKAQGETFEDPGYRKHIAQRYPETKTDPKGTKLQFGYRGVNMPDNERPGLRFHKTYR
tara:strand:+ start:100 stop:486 length:387 start_codon:yes stop_codon:yes gene_type:complete